MKSGKILLTFFTILIGFNNLVLAQETSESGPSTLSKQFQDIKENSNNWTSPTGIRFEVIREENLNDFFKSVKDSLADAKSDFQELKNTIARLEQEVDNLEKQALEKDKAVEEGEYDRSHINVLGIDFQKETYIYISWGIILLLVILILVLYASFKRSNKVAVEKRTEYEKLEQDYNEFKLRSREKELKIMRELQTERNLNEELSQKLATRK